MSALLSRTAPSGRDPFPFVDPGIPEIGRFSMPRASGHILANHILANHILDRLASSALVLGFEQGEEIIAQDEPNEYCFQVVEGCVRTVRLFEDGRRMVGEFIFPGEVFGCDMPDAHEFAVEAVARTQLRRFRCQEVEDFAERDRGFAQELRRHVTGQMRAARFQLVLLGRLSACERIAAFLLAMSSRLGQDDRNTMELPMSRADIADYLCLTIETVSRGLTELRVQGAIAVSRSHIAIRDRRALCLMGAEGLPRA